MPPPLFVVLIAVINGGAGTAVVNVQLLDGDVPAPFEAVAVTVFGPAVV